MLDCLNGHRFICSTTLSGRHPVSKDVNRIMKNFFDEGGMVAGEPDGDAKDPISKKDD